MSETSWNRLNWAPKILWLRRKCPHCDSLKFKQAELRPYDGFLRALLRYGQCAACSAGGDTTGSHCSEPMLNESDPA